MADEQKPKKSSSLLKRIYRGQWLSVKDYKRNIIGVVVVVAMFIIYISFKFDVQMKIAQIIHLSEVLANAKTNMVNASSEYSSKIRESELTQKARHSSHVPESCRATAILSGLFKRH